MKRSEINKALKELEAMCAQEHCYLPPFCHFTPEAWESKGHEYDEVRDCMLGWDITDYGQGDFDHFGFSLITIRNGNRAMRERPPSRRCIWPPATASSSPAAPSTARPATRI